jgi:hypothetical protein
MGFEGRIAAVTGQQFTRYAQVPIMNIMSPAKDLSQNGRNGNRLTKCRNSFKTKSSDPEEAVPAPIGFPVAPRDLG